MRRLISVVTITFTWSIMAAPAWDRPLMAQEPAAHENPPIPAGKVVLVDEFTDPTSGWLVSDFPGGQQAYDNGEYRVVARAPGGPIRIGWREQEVARDFVVEVDAWLPRGNEGESVTLGVRFVGARSGMPGGVMRFQVRPSEGRAWFGPNIWDGARWNHRPIVETADHPAIRRGSAVNRLGVKVHGSSYVAYVNGQEILHVDDGTFTGGGLVLGAAGPQGADTEARFDNLVIRELSGE